MALASAPLGSCSPERNTAARAWFLGLPAIAAVLACTMLAGCSNDGTPQVGPDASSSAGVCVGVKPPLSAWSTDPSGGGGAGPDAPDAGPAVGEPPPKWALTDFQPQSCGFGAAYGLDVFRGEVTLLAVLEGF